jgi:phospholipid/cholesterol/gamma-HCH transport system ATP-binding protein
VGRALNEHYIEFRGVSKAFGERRVLDNVSFFVDAAETLVILGRSGVGKSVTLKHILGFLKPDSGRVIVAAQDITDWDEDRLREIRNKVTMVFQSGALFDSLSVWENVAFPLHAKGESGDEEIETRVSELLEMLEVTEFAGHLPAELSTGVKRAVAIARALAQEPEAILFDEPTTMVDPVMAAHIGDLIHKLKERFHRTAVVVTHDTHLARRLADRVVFLHEGRAVFFGPWKEFESTDDPFLRNFQMQDARIPAMDVVT